MSTAVRDREGGDANGTGTSSLVLKNGSLRTGSTGPVKVEGSGDGYGVANSSAASKARLASARVKDWDEYELKVLPSDEGFKWAKDNYSSIQRTIDVWSFVLTLRARVYFTDAKWSFLGGFSEEKQVS